MNKLTDKKILSIEISDDQYYLKFETNDGIIAYVVIGDCCSEAWFADITGVDALIGGTVNVVESVNMDWYNVDDERGRQEFDVAYGYKFITDKGRATIVFRNSSNGYYGGELVEIDPTKLPKNMIQIVNDWSA